MFAYVYMFWTLPPLKSHVIPSKIDILKQGNKGFYLALLIIAGSLAGLHPPTSSGCCCFYAFMPVCLALSDFALFLSYFLALYCPYSLTFSLFSYFIYITEIFLLLLLLEKESIIFLYSKSAKSQKSLRAIMVSDLLKLLKVYQNQ